MSEEERNTAIDVAYGEQGAFDPVVPEKTLLAAILMNAIRDLHQNNSADAIKAAEYMLNPDDDYIFSFQSICNYLSIDPKRVLKVAGLLKTKK